MKFKSNSQRKAAFANMSGNKKSVKKFQVDTRKIERGLAKEGEETLTKTIYANKDENKSLWERIVANPDLIDVDKNTTVKLIDETKIYTNKESEKDDFEYTGVVASYPSAQEFYFEEFETLPQEWIQIMEDDGFKLSKKTEDFLWQKNTGGWTVWDQSDYVKGAYILTQKDRQVITDYWNFKRKEERGEDNQGFEKLTVEEYQQKEMAKFLGKSENKKQFDSLMEGLKKEGIVPPKK